MRNGLRSAAWSLIAGAAIAGASLAATPALTTPGWRGDGSGRYPDADPPTAWSKTENVAWKTRLPKSSHTSLILVGDRLFTMAEPAELLCLDAATGEIVWRKSHGWDYVFDAERAARIEKDLKAADEVRREIDMLRKRLNDMEKLDEKLKEKIDALREEIKEREGERQRLNAHPSPNRGGAGNTATTPATDGRRIYATLGNGIVSAHGLDGSKAWAVFVQPPALGFGHASSPVLADGKVIVHYGDLVALDAKTGKEVWRLEVDARYGSLTVGRVGDIELVVTANGTVARASDGEKIAEKLFQVEEASPCVTEGVVYAVDAGRAWAYRLETIVAEGSKSKPLWTAKVTNSRRFASPLVHDGLLHTVSSNGLYDVLDATTGESALKKRLDLGESNVYASPTLAGELLFLSGGNGRSIVVRPGREFEEVAVNELERHSGSPVFHGRRMFVRAGEWVYCIGE